MSHINFTVEITSIDSNVINGAIIVNEKSAGTIQFTATVLGRIAIKNLRKAGIEVILPSHLKDSLR